MTEEQLTLGAVAFELGLPALLVFLSIRKLSLRRHTISMLGAVTPMLVVYLLLTLSYAIDPANSNLAFHASWIMTFFAYLVLAFTGFLLGFWSKPRTLIARFFAAFLVAPVCAILLLTV